MHHNKDIMNFKTINQILAVFKNELQTLYPFEEIRNFVTLILESQMGYSRIDVLMKADEPLSDELIAFCKEALQALKHHTPIQYILGETEFYGLRFKVNPSVLIPRPETEELVHWIIEDNQLASPAILDIGTGSGCIPISLKRNIKDANVSAWDISDEALNTANINALLNQVEISFLKQDALQAQSQHNTYNIIVSNPPYVRELEKEMMNNNVLNHEPHLALFVDDHNPLLFYKAISEYAIHSLQTKGTLFFEINEALAKETKELMQTIGFQNIEVRNDLFGKPRMIKGVK